MQIAPATAAPTPQTGGRNALISSDFETFLKMLTTQMQNQDPLNPMDSADYAVQLATFSGVEQQMKTNQLLQGLAGQMGVMGMAQLAGWVGMQARADAPAWFDGAPITLSLSPDALADRSVLVVTDANGVVVSREDIPDGATLVDWIGVNTSGADLPQGKYSFALENWSGGERLPDTAVEHYAPIVEARAGAGGTVLILAGGIEIASDKVTALRQP